MIVVDRPDGIPGAVDQARRAGGGEVVIRAGDYVVPAGWRPGVLHDVTIRGEGDATRIRSAGAAGDALVLGNGKAETRNLTVRDLAIVADSKRGHGWALRLDRCVRTLIDNVSIDPVERGWRHTHGLWLNGFDDVRVSNAKVNTRVRGIVANGYRDQSYGGDLYIGGGSKVTNFRLPDEWQPGSAGVQVAGAAGGVYLTEMDVIYCGVGVLIDQGIAGVPNREVFLGNGLYVDSCAEDGIRIGANGCSTLHAVGTWSASHGLRTGGFPNGNGLNVHHENPGLLGLLSGCRFYNCQGTGVAISGGRWLLDGCVVNENGGHGVHRAHSGAVVKIGNVLLYKNARGDLAGI